MMGDNSAPEGDRGHPSVLPRRLINGRMADKYYEPFPSNFFAPISRHARLEITIIGAGIAGLSAAVALTQSGHNVEVLRYQLRIENVAYESSYMRDRGSPTR